MKVSDILVRDASVLDLAATDKDGVLTELAAALGAAEESVDETRLLEVLREREALQSTGIGDGVAIPHGKLAGIDRLLAAFARSGPGVEFAAIDGKPTHIFFILVVPEHSGGQHLKALARISRFLRDEAFRAKLESATTLDAVFSAIEEEDAKF
jgi:PTS system nitrogen regulatory IIA component